MPAPDGTTLLVQTGVSQATAWIVMQGEADVSNLERLSSALASIRLDDVDAMHIHVHDLDFIDVAAFRQLTTFTKHVKQTGRAVMTYGAHPIVRRMAQILRTQDQLDFC